MVESVFLGSPEKSLSILLCLLRISRTAITLRTSPWHGRFSLSSATVFFLPDRRISFDGSRVSLRRITEGMPTAIPDANGIAVKVPTIAFDACRIATSGTDAVRGTGS
ncbi:hypothetical protein Fot_32331 [Forsythia ovata]|uniref:Uncharacterized protein n=1 Tax=Forsythia ovata TaxID=205694 RepID=A0ABD1T7H8_9LAMI